MNKISFNYSNQVTKKNILIIGLIYWVLLMFWQVIRIVDNHSGIDLFVKLLLVAYLLISTALVSGFKAKFSISKLVLLIIIILINVLSLLINFSTFSAQELLYYLFPIIIFFIYFIINQKTYINNNQLVIFLKGYVFVILILMSYNILFRFNEFISIFKIRQAYGSEMSSFLASSHEFGMYLVFGIYALLLLYRITKKNLVTYFIIVLLMVLNLVSTISRTSIFSLAIGIIVLFAFSGFKRTFVYFIILFLTVLISFSFPPIREYIFTVILKENNSAARDFLLVKGFELFESLPMYRKLLGYGFGQTNRYLNIELGHNSFHNAYLNVLLYGGLLQFLLFLSLLLYIIKKSYNKYKQNKYLGSIIISMSITCIFIMFTNTSIIMTSPIDSFLLTIFAFLIPVFWHIDTVILKENGL